MTGVNTAWHSALSGGDRIARAIVAAALIVGVMLLFIVSPEKMPFEACGFHSLTGHSCPTCGMTRALHAIAHGELVQSVKHHLMGLPLFLLMLLSLIVLSLEAASGRRVRLIGDGVGARWVAILFFVVWLTYWGVRLVMEFVA